ncbi:hypothetical protein KC19_2G091100 [Ceratodon purpureus]|uniref:Uncharacterized protein n=3 Tax=Ceratodon purpureus TaxID=3225 RepID=A0A8T0IUF7_CERPU|nr:hypothetical protein KC19_2G091100 [Ceratodon purpureus]KAG0586447.1 hypothetical protein KC19_2G091100 [Ceratodon purpureus]KAG0586450.1 hypothetical protein KC19_2G091100 [Ceratodon purpureus]
MTMEEMWNMRASSMKSSAQPVPSATNQFNMDAGQLSQPYMAKEVCVIERTFRQEPMVPNMMNYGSQGLHPDKLRSELLAMVSGSQQHVTRSSYSPSMSGRSPYGASLSQLSPMNLPDLSGYGGWPMPSPSILSQANRVDGSAKTSAGADVSLGQGRDFGGMSGGRNHDNFPVNVSRAAGTELLNHSSSFGRGAQEMGLEGNWQLPSPQWGAEPARQRQRQQSAQASTLFSTNSEPCRGVTSALNASSGLLSQAQSVPAPTSSGGLRVYCINCYGLPVVGQLGLTDAGRLGVTCTCHGQHMSVAKFTQHSGLNAANPGEVVYMEGGETLVQWRKSFFSQYGVKVPEDNVGWEWLDVVGAVESGHGNGKYKAVVTQSWQKEVDVSCGGNTPVMKSRTTQMWDASISNGNSSTLHAMESISNTKYGSLNTGNGGMVDTRELKNYGQSQSYRGASMASDLGSPMSGQFYTASTHESLSRGQGNMSAGTFQGVSHSGHLAMNNGHNFTNDGGQRYSWTGQQVSGVSRSGKGANHTASRLSEGQESRMRENDIASSFELRLGQPSQQTQAAGTSFSSIATSSVEHPKSYLFEQIMNKVWDGKLQHNVQQFNPANLPKFSGIPGQARDQHGARQSAHGSIDRVDSCGLDRRGEERGPGYPSAAQSPRHMSHSSQAGFKPESGVSELQGKLMALDSFHQSNMSNRSGDRQFRGEQSGSEKLAAKLFPHTGPTRNVTLENGTPLDSLSSGALVQLSNKTGQRLLETAIQSSFTYRAMGLQGPVAQPSGNPSNRVNPEGLSGNLDVFGRPSVGGRASFPEFLVRKQGQHDANLGSAMAVDGLKGSRLEQDPNSAFWNRAFQMQEPGTPFPKQHAVHRAMLDDCSERGSVAEREPERQNSTIDRSGREWPSEEQQGTVNDKQGGGRSQGGPKADCMVMPRLESKVHEAVIPSRLIQGLAGSEGNEGEHTDVQSQHLAELAGRDVRDVETEAVSVQENVEVATLSGGDIQCSCLKCRKASPSVRGQAVPRLAGQVCLKEKAGLASSVDVSRKVILGEGEKNAVEDPAHVEQPSSMPEVEMDTVEVRMRSMESSREALAWEPRREDVEEVDVKRVEVGAECDEVIPENEDLLSDTAAKGTTAGRGSPHSGEAIPEVDVCSNNSENLSSGLSDGDCAVSDKGAPVVMQESGTTSIPGVVDEGSGIGKCCSSDDVDMGVGRNPNAFSALEDPNKVVGSPSSLGCPSSSNMGRKLVMKRGGVRGSKEINDEVEAEPVASTGKLERKQRRNTKWKWLGSGVDGGDAMEGSPASSFGQEAEPQVTSEDARIGLQLQEAVTRPDALKRDFRASSGEMVAPSKRRKLLIPRRHQEVKATNVTEENLEAVNLDLSEDSKKKAGTLVIRVPQGVNRQKAKKGIRTKLQLKCGTRDWRSGAGEDGVPGEGDGRRDPEAGKLATPRPVGRPMKASGGGGSGSGSMKAVGLGPIGLPSFATKNIRSPRTPLAGPCPRNGRMVSLSAILNQPTEAKQVPTPVDVRAPVQKLRDGVARLRKEGTLHKRLDAHVGSVNVTGGHVKEVEAQGGPAMGMGVPWKGEGRTRVVQKKEDAQSRKIRSLLELTGKNDVHGPGASGASVFEFVEDENVTVSRASKQATASAAVQTDRPAAGLGSVGTKSCPFPRGERSARPGGPNRRKFPEWPRNVAAQVEAGKRSSLVVEAEKVASEKAGTYVCQVSQVRSAAGSSISKEKLQQGFSGPGFPVRKQVRSSKVKRSSVAGEGSQTKDVRAPDVGVRVPELGAVKHEARQTPVLGKGGLTGNGVLKRTAELGLAEVSAKRPKVVLALKKVKEAIVSEIEGSIENGELLKSSSRGLYLEQKKMKTVVEDLLGCSTKIQKKEKSQVLDVNGRASTWRKERTVGGVLGNHLGPAEKCKCDVCGTFSSASYNKLLCCSRCPVKVHQACYGVPKIPKGPWMCRTCKFKVSNPASPTCVLCGYGGGAMTRVQKARPFCLALLQIWRDLKNENGREPYSDNDDDETLLAVTNNTQLSRMRSTGGPTRTHAKKVEKKVKVHKSCDCEEPRDASSVCMVCRKDSPEPGSSGGNVVRRAEKGPNASLELEDWRNNTVGCIVKDAGAKQWAHMVCTLWMPGTRCLNMGTMGVFDVSGVTTSRRKAVCSICKRKGGACIQCRVPKCSTSFHVWCAHEKGLLQSEIVQDGSNQVGFFGRCQSHADYCGSELHDEMKEGLYSGTREVCARTEGYKGRLSLEERAKAQQRMIAEGSTAVTPQQVAAWLRIDERKLSNRRLVKSANSSMSDQREYLRFKQKKGWKKLGVYKSGIHALGLYTTDFIAEGEVVVEYVGEIVGLRVADKREAEYHSGKRLQYQGACYLFRIDTEQIIDATRKGGIARFVNHSCSPNCVAKVISVENLKKVVFFAKRDIYAGEEVTYDYKFNCDEVDDKIPCFCGSPECRGTLN